MRPRPEGAGGLLLLGVVQGVTEWWPVSSSLHLRLVRRRLGSRATAEQARAVDAALHAGTGLAAVVALRADLRRLVPAGAGVLRRRQVVTADERLALGIALSVLPAALLGARGGPLLERRLAGDRATAVLLAVAGLGLAAADVLGPEQHRLGSAPGPVLGGVAWAQAAALAPGVSRSGATLTAARALGVARPDAVRLSALMALPVVAGAVVRTAGDLRGSGVRPGPLVLGAASAAVTGHLALRCALAPRSPRGSVAVAGYRVLVAAGLWRRATTPRLRTGAP